MKTKVNLRLALFGGSGIGLLFGVIMGSSITPTVATILGALSGLLTAILGLNDQYFNDAKAMRIGAFGIACVFGAYTGIFVRSHNLLSPSLQELKQDYMEAGFSEQQALNFIAIKEFGASLIANNTENNQADVDGIAEQDTAQSFELAANTAVMQQHSSLLFSANVKVSGCEELQFTDASLPLDEIVNNFELTGGKWEQLIEKIDLDANQSDHKTLLLKIKNVICLDDIKPLRQDCSVMDKAIKSHPLTYPHPHANNNNYLKELPSTWHQLVQDSSEDALAERLHLHFFKYLYLMVCE